MKSKLSPEAKAALKKVGTKIETVDHHLVRLLARRTRLAETVCRIKLGEEKPERLVRLPVETKRLNQVRGWAIDEGISPHFAKSVLYSIIGESCKHQATMRDKFLEGNKGIAASSFSYDILRKNLLKLTKGWARKYDEGYGQDRFATKLQMDFENRLISEQINKLPKKGVLLDLGCATGRETFQHSNQFVTSIGYDVSEEMITVANEKAKQKEVDSSVIFKVHDVEQPLPLDDESVSFVFMNNGTASDVKNFDAVLKEVSRVLEKGGKFLFSFYNAEALVNEVFLPWPTSLMAEINRDQNCLDVNFKGKRISIYAQPYTSDQLKGMFERQSLFETPRVRTYPVLSSILPNELFEKSTSDLFDISKQIIDIDQKLSEDKTNKRGAYIVVTGTKNKI